MRFTTLWLDGYGRFSDHRIELKSGLQVILGPNEQGKSTIRNFISDMLYGQRRGAQRNFDDANELRRPWTGGERYAGRLVYVLDDKREIEVQRDFDKKRGTIAVFDRTHMRDITAEFERLKNKEPNFAEQHLGLSKAVYLSTATIGPMTLDDLGDDDALAQIREKIVSLADTSDESGTADAALRILNDRIGEIGRAVSHSKKPLPLAKQRLDRLDQELAKARAAGAEIATLEAKWNKVSEQLTAAKRRKTALDDELHAIEKRDRATRLAEAQKVQKRIDEVTQICFANSSLREFPLEQAADVQRAANATTTARTQAERSSAELNDIEEQLREESDALDSEGVPQLVEIPEAIEHELSTLDSKIVRLRERVEELEAELARSRDRFAQAQRDLQPLPDFSRLGADPVAWLSQLANSFRVARQSRNSVIEKLSRLRSEIAKRKAARETVAALFDGFPDFVAESREYEVSSRVNEDRITQLKSDIEALRIESEERHNAGPYAIWTAVLFGGVAFACVAAAIGVQNTYVYIPAGVSAALLVMSLGRWFWLRNAVRKAESELKRTTVELTRVVAESGAILDYLARWHGGGVLSVPVDAAEWPTYLHWMHFAEGSAMLPLMLHLYTMRLGEAGAPLQPRISSEIDNHLSYMDGALAGKDFLVGGRLTAADIQNSFVLEAARTFGRLGSYANLARVLDAWQARPAYQRGLEKGGPYAYASKTD